MNSGGVFSGTFSGCEISRQAGSVSGTFKIVVRFAPASRVGFVRATRQFFDAAHDAKLFTKVVAEAR